MRRTLNYTYRDLVKQHKQKRAIKSQGIQNALKSIHRPTLHTQLNNESGQLGTPPSKIAEGEQTLPRIALIRCTTVNTGYCPLLNSYLCRFSNNVDNSCPKCELAPHEVNHISHLQ